MAKGLEGLVLVFSGIEETAGIRLITSLLMPPINRERP